jgi:hypothetical protein
MGEFGYAGSYDDPTPFAAMQKCDSSLASMSSRRASGINGKQPRKTRAATRRSKSDTAAK